MDDNDEKIRIERILGISAINNSHFDSDSGVIAYPAGNTIVLLDIGSGTVISHVVLETRKPISAIQLSGPYLFVASDEVNFLRVANWESNVVKDLGPIQNVVCCAVSSSLGVLVTVGSDRVVSVWDYKTLISSTSNAGTPTSNNRTGTPNNSRGRKLASSSVACKVSCVHFSPDGNHFITGGTRHLKFWYIQLGKNECVLTGRPAILGSEHSSADFVDVITDGLATYATANFDGTISSTLCQFDDRRFLDKWVQLKTKQAFCMCMDEDLIFIGCADGLVRCFRAGKLDFVATLPLPHHLGVDITAATDVTALSSHPPVSKFPNVVAITAPGGKKIVAVYADHSLYSWDVQDVKRVGLSHSWLWHSGCIWDISVGKSIAGSLTQANTPNNWPSFVTCSTDDTVRVWDITSPNKRNLYSSECTSIKYLSTRYLDSPLFLSHGNGVRCLGIGSNFLACGDRQGNLRLWSEGAKNEVIKIKAHKEEILGLDVIGSLVATASRAVHLYDIHEEIDRVATLQEHTSTVTSVKFFFTERSSHATLHLASCSADKTIVIRQIVSKTTNSEHFSTQRSFLSALIERELEGNLEVIPNSIITSKTPLFDFCTDTNGKHILVACQDYCVRVYSVSSGKHSKTLRNTNHPGGGSLPTVIKITIDSSGYYVAIAATDKSITVFDYLKGEVVGILLGHSELSTALAFTPDFKSLLSVGGDSCIFVWALPREMVVTMKARMGEKRSRSIPPPVPSKPSALNVNTPSPLPSSNSSSPTRGPDYRFSFGQLPDWAKKQITGETGTTTKKTPVALPQGKWSERVENSSTVTIKSFHDSETVFQVPFMKSTPTGQQGTVPLRRPSVSENNNLDTSFEVRPESLSEILYKEEESLPSSDFYSDVKSTDGEPPQPPPKPKPRRNQGVLSDTTDTDESSSTARTTRSGPAQRLIAAHRERESPSNQTQHPYEVNRRKNDELIMSVKLKNREISKSRLELEKRLEDTRRKLENIGHRSMSQSTTDLTRGYGHDYLDDSSEENADDPNSSSMRRACSLSDLNNSNPKSNLNTPTAPTRRKRSFNKHRNRTRTNGPGFDPQNIITRSTSMSALMVQLQQSDSEPESLPAKPSYMSKTISSQGKSKRKPTTVVSAYSQENLHQPDESRLRAAASEQNLFKSSPRFTPGKTSTPNIKKPQQVHSSPKGMAVVTGIRQGSKDDHLSVEGSLTVDLASQTVDALKRSLDHVIYLKNRVSVENVPEREPIGRTLEEGLIAAQLAINETIVFTDRRTKIYTDTEPIVL